MSGDSERLKEADFDLQAQMRAWESGQKVIDEMSLARQAAESAKTTRELAHAKVRIAERAIRKLLDSGVSRASILEGLTDAMPEIPKVDLTAALEAVRFRLIRERKKANSNLDSQLTPTKSAVSNRDPKTVDLVSGLSDQEQSKTLIKMATPKPENAGLAAAAIADGSDRMAGESEADYQLRKSLEPSPPAKGRFIGEN